MRPGHERCRTPPKCVATSPPVRPTRLKRRRSCEARGSSDGSQDEHGAWCALHDVVHDRGEDAVEHVVAARGDHGEIGGISFAMATMSCDGLPARTCIEAGVSVDRGASESLVSEAPITSTAQSFGEADEGRPSTA